MSTAPELSTEERARVAAFEAAEEPEEIRVERVAVALFEADGALTVPDDYRELARAAIAALDRS